MDKLKNLVSRKDTPETEAPAASPQTGRLAGQGSHFPQGEEQLASGTTGSQGTTAGNAPGTDAGQEREVAPSSGLSGSGAGTAAIGETSTYSSHGLATGDALGGVADPNSADPTTYKMPEHSYASNTGVTEGGPMAAAAAAFHKDRGYSTSNLPGAYPRDTAHDTVTMGPPLTSGDRTGIHGPTDSTGMQDASAAAQSATSAASANREPVADEPKKSSTVGKILGAVGLGTAAAGAGAATSRARDDAAHSDIRSHDQPTTTTGVGSYTSPSQSTPTDSGLASSGQAPRHHRKESIPTTAYPAGVDSPAAISAPVGGTTASPGQERGSHTGRNVGVAAAGLGAGAGAGVLGAHEYENRDPREVTTRLASGSPGTHATSSSAVAPGYTQDNSNLSRGTYQTPQSSAAEPGRTTHDHGKAATAAGLGAGAGAGALGAHEYEKRDRSEGAPGTSSQYPTAQATSSNIPPSYSQDNSNLRRDYNETPTSTSMEPERDTHGYGKTAAAAGVGVGAGAAGAYALGHRQPEQQGSDWPLREDTGATQGSSAVPTSHRAMETQPMATSSQEQYSAPSGPPPTRDTGIAAAPYASQSRYEEPSQKHTAREDAALAGAAGTGAGAATTSKLDEDQARADEEAKQRKRRHEEEAGLAGVAGAGAGAAGLHEHKKHQAEEDEARRQKDLSEQEEARRKQFEKDQKAAEKEAKKEEKQQAKEEKAIAKEEKKQQKEAEKEEKKQEKEEKQHQKELEKQESRHEKAAVAEREQQEKLDREAHERREKEAAAAAGLGAAGGAGAYAAHDKDKHTSPTTATDETGRNKLHKDPPEEKKPSFLKRLFGRRKNKNTGEDEDYEYDEGNEDEGHHHGAAAAGAGTGAAVAGTAAATSHDAPANSYAAQSGGATKPSYNPFTKDDPATTGTVPGTATGYPHGTTDEDDLGQESSANYDPADPNYGSSTGHGPFQPDERVDQMGGLTAGHQYGEGEQKPGLATWVKDSLRPLPERDQLQQHSQEYHGTSGTGSNTYGTTQQFNR